MFVIPADPKGDIQVLAAPDDELDFANSPKELYEIMTKTIGNNARTYYFPEGEILEATSHKSGKFLLNETALHFLKRMDKNRGEL